MEAHYTPHGDVHGFTTGKGVKTSGIAIAKAVCMLPDPERFIVISLDISGFFSGIKLTTVKRTMRALGASRLEAQEMAYWATYGGCLPQGSPCSPIIANAVAGNLDTALHGLAAGHQGVYVRYADDITLIVRKGGRSPAEWLEKLCNLVTAFGFAPHPEKRATRPLTGHNGFEVTGITVHVKKAEATIRPRRRVVRSARASLVCKKDNAEQIVSGYAFYLTGHQAIFLARKTEDGYYPRYRPFTKFMERTDVAILIKETQKRGPRLVEAAHPTRAV